LSVPKASSAYRDESLRRVGGETSFYTGESAAGETASSG
jgi:hypothetical protein